jgi:DNA polymerase III subunit delta'
MLLSWLVEPSKALLRSIGPDGGALLVSGVKGIGKRCLADHVARMRLCHSPREEEACGQCSSCGLADSGNHPDLILIEPVQEETDRHQDAFDTTSGKKPKSSPFITIDQVRTLLATLEVTPHGHKGRVVIIDPADRLNPSAANALLKTLEDLPSMTVFLLLTTREQRLPMTLRSRCVRLPVSVPREEESIAWLRGHGTKAPELVWRLAGGAPLRALELDRGGVVERWERLASQIAAPGKASSDWDTAPANLLELCELLQMHCVDLLRIQLGGAARYGVGREGSLPNSAMSPTAVSDFWKALGQVKASIHHPLNGALVRDQLLCNFARLLTA